MIPISELNSVWTWLSTGVSTLNTAAVAQPAVQKVTQQVIKEVLKGVL